MLHNDKSRNLLFIKEIIKGLNKEKGDTDKYKYLLTHKDVFCLMLDNDKTYIFLSSALAKDFTQEEVDDFYESMNQLDNYLGWYSGTEALLDAIGIEWSHV